jgi:hypothetical protein
MTPSFIDAPTGMTQEPANSGPSSWLTNITLCLAIEFSSTSIETAIA